MCALLLSGTPVAHAGSTEKSLEQLTEERLLLIAELEQYRATLTVLHTDGSPAETSDNPAVRTLASSAQALEERLVVITEQEVALLQAQILAGSSQALAQGAAATSPTDPAGGETDAAPAVDAMATAEPEPHHETASVERLHQLLENYDTGLQETPRMLPSAEDIARREAARLDAEALQLVPFSADKVRLSGSEGSTALATISQRLVDPRIPESRRDIAPICIIKTRLLDTLIVSENRSLRPVGKNHYVLRARLQPGETTISVMSNEWTLELPEHSEVRDFLITLYRPATGTPELHVFAVDELLALEKPHIPAWLPREFDLQIQAG